MGKRAAKRPNLEKRLIRAALKITRWADDGNGYLINVRSDELLHLLGHLHKAAYEYRRAKGTS